MTAAAVVQTLAKTAAVLIAAVVVYFAFIFEGPFPDHPALQGQNDLALHVIAFAALSIPLLLLHSWKRNAALLVLFAGGIEIVQLFQPRRSADLSDFAGSAAGIALAALVVLAMRGIAWLVASNKEQIDE